MNPVQGMGYWHCGTGFRRNLNPQWNPGDLEAALPMHGYPTALWPLRSFMWNSHRERRVSNLTIPENNVFWALDEKIAKLQSDVERGAAGYGKWPLLPDHRGRIRLGYRLSDPPLDLGTLTLQVRPEVDNEARPRPNRRRSRDREMNLVDARSRHFGYALRPCARWLRTSARRAAHLVSRFTGSVPTPNTTADAQIANALHGCQIALGMLRSQHPLPRL